MLKKAFKSILFLAAFLAAGSFNTYAQERVVADEIVAVVGNSAILLSELETAAGEVLNQRRSQGYTSDRDARHEALELLMMQKLLYNQALHDSIPVSFESIESVTSQVLEQEVATHGSVKAVEEFYNKPIFEVRDDIRTRFQESQYAQAMRQDIESSVTVTPSEVERFYRRTNKDELPIIPEQYIYAQITKYPPSTEDAKFRARERLLEMRERIMNGTRFDVLARMYSVDGSAVRGGEMDPTSKDGFVKPFSEAMVKLAVGQVSGVVETEYGFHLIEMLEIMPNNVYRCRHILIRPTFTDEELSGAVALLDSARMQITREDDPLSFADAAARYSDDKYSKLNGGVVTNFDILELYQAMDARLATNRFMKEDLGRDNYNQISMMKEGDISKPFISEDTKGNVMANMIKLIEIVPSHQANINDDYISIENIALTDKKNQAFQDFVEKKVESMYIRIDDRFKDAEFENQFWFK